MVKKSFFLVNSPLRGVAGGVLCLHTFERGRFEIMQETAVEGTHHFDLIYKVVYKMYFLSIKKCFPELNLSFNFYIAAFVYSKSQYNSGKKSTCGFNQTFFF